MDLNTNADQAVTLPLDLDSIDTALWPRRDWPVTVPAASAGVTVVVETCVVERIHEHGQSRTEVEVCGVLVGQGYQTPQGPLVLISGAIPGEHATHQAAQVTFTAATWNHIQDVLEREYPDQRILGWYHTHPGFGIFLSEMDLFIHRHFFSSGEQLAWVYDPINAEEGIFLWRAGQPVRETVAVIPDSQAPAATTACQWIAGPQGPVPSAVLPNSEQRSRRARAWNWFWPIFLFATVTSVAMWAWLFRETWSHREQGNAAPREPHSSPRSARKPEPPRRPGVRREATR